MKRKTEAKITELKENLQLAIPERPKTNLQLKLDNLWAKKKSLVRESCCLGIFIGMTPLLSSYIQINVKKIIPEFEFAVCFSVSYSVIYGPIATKLGRRVAV